MEASLDPWRPLPNQRITSAGTSVRMIPRALRIAEFRCGGVNVDIGGGRFDDATSALAAMGVENLVFDPFNRSPGHNGTVAARVRDGGADTATALNVLNVLACAAARDRVVALAADAIRSDGTAWFQVYEGNRSGVPAATPRGWQENRALSSYLPEILVHFGAVEMRRDVVSATGPRPAPWRADGRVFRTLEQALAASVRGASHQHGADR